MPTFKLISFDVDDTLIDFQAMQRRGMEVVAAAMHNLLGGDHVYITPDYLLDRYHQAGANHDPVAAPWRTVRRRVFAEVLAEAGRPDAEPLADDLLAGYLRTFDASLSYLPGALDLLEALRGRFALGWLTNGNTTPEEAGLSAYFDVIVMPERQRLKKPDPAVFVEAARQAGCAVGEILHVGDSLASDVAGALAAGCRAVWYNPTGKPEIPGIVPDVTIVHLDEVLRLLEA